MTLSINDTKAHFTLNIVSTEGTLFSGTAEFVLATGLLGELGIVPGHTPLITALKPGELRIKLTDGNEDIFYVSGGTLEVQANRVTILADTAIRAEELDEAAAKKAKKAAEKALEDQHADFDYSNTLAQLAEAAAKLQAIQHLRSLRKIRR